MANQPATPEEILQSQILTVEALIRLLGQKGIVKMDELMKEILKVKEELKSKREQN